MATVYFAHGKESGPQGGKIEYLAQIARAMGHQVESIDYQDLDDADARVARLQQALANQDPADVILVGSSMGGYVSMVTSAELPVRGVFLLAPALKMSGYRVQNYPSKAASVCIVHGWDDETIPVEHSLRVAGKYRYSVHLLNGDHRLLEPLAQVGELFRAFLSSLS